MKVKVFSHQDRGLLENEVNNWLKQNPNIKINFPPSQSSALNAAFGNGFTVISIFYTILTPR